MKRVKKKTQSKGKSTILRHYSPLLTSRFATRFQHLSSKNKDISPNQRDKTCHVTTVFYAVILQSMVKPIEVLNNFVMHKIRFNCI
jgi:hypothetical protein